MGTYTERLKLYKPDVDEMSWGNLVNGNFDKIDNATPQQLGVEPKFVKQDAYNKMFGDSEGTVCQGNDPRLSHISAVPPHADPTTKYGVPTIYTLYGHVKATSTMPKENGDADIGYELSTFARGDHVHPKQDAVSGNAGTTTKLAEAHKIGLSGAVVSEAQPFDGTEDISIPVNEIDIKNVEGDIPVMSLPPATKSTKGCVIVGDGLLVDEDGVLKLKDGGGGTGTVRTVYSKGSHDATDITLGTLSYTLEPSDKSRFEKSTTSEEPITLVTDLKYIYNQTAFTKSKTLPTVFEAAEKLYGAATKEVTCTLSTVASAGPSICKFSFIRSSDRQVISTVDVTASTKYKLTFPRDWDYTKDSFDVIGTVGFTTTHYITIISIQFDSIAENNIQIYL